MQDENALGSDPQISLTAKATRFSEPRQSQDGSGGIQCPGLRNWPDDTDDATAV